MEKYGESLDFFAIGKEIYSTDGDLIIEYGDNDKSKVLFSCDTEEQQVIRISVFQESFAFLIRKENIL